MTGPAPAGAMPPPAAGRVLNICPNTLLTLAILLAIVFVARLGTLSALAVLGFGGLLVLRVPGLILEETRRALWIHAIPAWCLLSVLWSAYPALSLRFGLQLAITFAIAVTIASRLAPLVFVKTLFAAFAAATVASLLVGRVRWDGGWLGIYDSKNAFAAAMSMLLMLSLALLLDRTLARRWRIAGMAGLLAGVPLLVRAQSAGALLTTALAVGVMLGLFLLRRTSAPQRLLLGGMLLLGALAAALLAAAFQDAILAAVLETTGKDASLTGRTDLWRAALGEIARNPLFGQGYQAVWVPGNPLAERMWALFGIPSKSGFHFHNTYLSNAVEIGVIGVALQAASLLAATVLTLRWALADPRAESVFLAVFMVRLLVLSLGETLVYFQFNLTTVVTVCALVYGMRARQAALEARRGGIPLFRPRAALS